MVLVPLLKSLEAMLNEPSVIKEVEQPHANTIDNGRIYDYCDSEACKLHPLFSRDPSALQIILYFDEVECVNPLGSKTKKHKIELENDNGYEFTISGRKRTFRGSIAFVSGDNLGLQELGGFKVGPGANCKCRECMGLADEIKRMVSRIKGLKDSVFGKHGW
ncbi:Hypothetical predicted protein, partial [Paramuricea clavata]